MKIVIITLCFLILEISILHAQWFDEQSLSSTVLLEKKEGNNIVPHGTGFLLWNYSNHKFPIVVTAAHLLKNRDELYLSVNIDSSLSSYLNRTKNDTVILEELEWVKVGAKLRTKLSFFEKPFPSFNIDTTKDIGIFLIDLATSAIIESGDSIRFADFLLIPQSMIRLRDEIALGDELYFVGFPFGIGTNNKIEPVIRAGSVAWVSEVYYEFLLDAFSFGGNSGSPVFSKSLIGRKIGHLSWDASYLVGMVIGHLGDKKEGILQQPDPQIPQINRITAELQNYGLARCIWIDEILELISQSKNLVLPKSKNIK